MPDNKKKFVSPGAKRVLADVAKLKLTPSAPEKRHQTITQTTKVGVIARSAQTYDSYVRACEVNFTRIMGADWVKPDKEAWRDAYDDELTPLEAAKYIAENEKAMAGIDGDEGDD